MNHQPILRSTADNKQLRLDLQPDGFITLEIEVPEHLEIYRGRYSYEALPNQITAIFDTVQEFYQFILEAQIVVENKYLIVPAIVVGKTKMLKLPLEEVELTGEWKLKKDILSLQDQLAKRTADWAALLNEKINLEQLLEQQTELTKERESQNLKLINRIRHLENSMDELVNDKAKSDNNNQQESRLTEEFTPVKKTHGGKTKKVKEIEDYGKRLVFKIDDRTKHYTKFKIVANQVEKLHGPTFQLVHNEPLPKDGKFYFDIKIILIKNNNIVVGIITEKNRDEQFSFKKPNSVCYNGYDGSICEQDRQSYVTIKPKEGNRLRTVIDMTLAQVQWYIMGGQMQRTSIGKAFIPPSMMKQLLYPYFELYWEGNKVKLNV